MEVARARRRGSRCRGTPAGVSRPLCADADRRRGAEEDGARQPLGDPSAARTAACSASILAGSAFGPSTSASMIAFHESCRYCVSSEFTAAVAERDRAGHDQRRLVLADPQRVDDGVHQPQHTAGALEPLQARPVLVEPVEQLGVDRVGLLDPVLVVGVARLARELVGVLAVELDERRAPCAPIDGQRLPRRG